MGVGGFLGNPELDAWACQMAPLSITSHYPACLACYWPRLASYSSHASKYPTPAEDQSAARSKSNFVAQVFTNPTHSPHPTPAEDQSATQIKANFAAQGFTVREMIALSGAHTIGETWQWIFLQLSISGVFISVDRGGAMTVGTLQWQRCYLGGIERVKRCSPLCVLARPTLHKHYVWQLVQ